MKVRLKTRLKEYRARHDLTQEQLANAVGVRRETIGHLENNRYNPSLILAHKLSKTLDTSIEELFQFEDDTE